MLTFIKAMQWLTALVNDGQDAVKPRCNGRNKESPVSAGPSSGKSIDLTTTGFTGIRIIQ